jgi:hypothetical protein
MEELAEEDHWLSFEQWGVTKKEYASVPTSCASCGRRNAPYACSGCKVQFYCNDVCQQQHWSAPAGPGAIVHADICTYLAKSRRFFGRSSRSEEQYQVFKQSLPPSIFEALGFGLIFEEEEEEEGGKEEEENVAMVSKLLGPAPPTDFLPTAPATERSRSVAPQTDMYRPPTGTSMGVTSVPQEEGEEILTPVRPYPPFAGRIPYPSPGIGDSGGALGSPGVMPPMGGASGGFGPGMMPGRAGSQQIPISNEPLESDVQCDPNSGYCRQLSTGQVYYVPYPGDGYYDRYPNQFFWPAYNAWYPYYYFPFFLGGALGYGLRRWIPPFYGLWGFPRYRGGFYYPRGYYFGRFNLGGRYRTGWNRSPVYGMGRRQGFLPSSAIRPGAGRGGARIFPGSSPILSGSVRGINPALSGSGRRFGVSSGGFPSGWVGGGARRASLGGTSGIPGSRLSMGSFRDGSGSFGRLGGGGGSGSFRGFGGGGGGFGGRRR